ncbi:ABC transporter substrate-binding protein [Labrys monachus]|uniref:ABC-type glycerol-3-phosphate transport system substrate-binding protein n=1 Tax=Labrys monachus TaxID=217067 RepID=A0ABU0F7U6_9HYPH|nr:extracellular solute-binding protein [Labrys monachus]MDQ0390688.1 ABC-type glycerol-3-phosphate transport system substrate-binding protein [Labrys monachus]
MQAKLSALLLAGTILAAAPAKAQEITVWDWKSGDPAAASYYEKVKGDFEAAHPGVTVNYVMQPLDQYYTLLGTALSSHAGPDLFLMNGGAQAKARIPALLRLDDKVADLRKTVIGWPEFTGADGGVYAVPLSIQGFVVYYDKKLYRDAGLDPDKPPRTWADLARVCAAIKAKGAVPCFSMGNKEGYGAEFWFSTMAANEWTAGEQQDFAAGRLKWSSPQVKAILQSWVDAGKAGWFQDGPNSTTKFMDEYEGFMRGEDANTIGLISDVAHWKQFDDFLGADDGVFRMPSPTLAADKTEGDPMMPVAGGIGYGVNKASVHADLAVELAKALAAPAAMQVFFTDTGAIASNTGVDTSKVDSPAAKAILAWLKTKGVPTAHANATAKELEEWHRQSQLLLNGEATVDAAAARLDAVQADARK